MTGDLTASPKAAGEVPFLPSLCPAGRKVLLVSLDFLCFSRASPLLGLDSGLFRFGSGATALGAGFLEAPGAFSPRPCLKSPRVPVGLSFSFPSAPGNGHIPGAAVNAPQR